MNNELLVTLRGDRLTLKCPQNGRHHTAFNTVCLDANGRALAIGKSREQIEKEDPQGWAKIATGARFVPILGDLSYIRATTACLLYFSVKMGANALTPGNFRQITLRMQYPGYQNLPEETRQRFEVATQQDLQLAELWINGQKVSHQQWRLWFAPTLRFLMTFPWMLLVLFAFSLFAAAASDGPDLTGRVVFVAQALLAIAVGITGAMACDLLWVYLMRRFVPRYYLRLLLDRPAGIILFPKRFRALADRMLADEQS